MPVEHTIQVWGGKEKTIKNLTPLKAIREKCLDCVCWSPKEVKLCPDTYCVNYPFRFGKYPEGAGRGMSAENRRKASERMKKRQAERNKDNQQGGESDSPVSGDTDVRV